MSDTIQITPYIPFFDQNLETAFAADMSYFFMVDKWKMPSFPVMAIW
jgi:hypothetical protein